MDLTGLTFLTPTAGIIAAAVCVPVVVFYYMLKLRRKPARVSTVMFFSASARDLEANVPLRMVRPSWLLLLHLLIVALFALALARPLIDAPFGSADRIVILLDRSASMTATDATGAGSRFDAAQNQALEEIDRLAGTGFRGELALIDVSARPRLRAGPTRSLGEVRAAVGRVTPSHDPADLAAALELVASLAAPRADAADPDATSTPPLVLLFSDGGATLDPTARVPGAGLNIAWTAPEIEPAYNAGLTAIAASRDPADPTRVSVFARVRTTDETVRTVTVACFAGSTEIERRAIRVPPGDEGLGVSFAFTAPADIVARLALPTPDALVADNRAAVFVPAASSPSILIVRPSTEPTRAGWLLEQTLREVAPGGVRITTPERAQNEPTPDLLVFDGAAAPESVFARTPTIAFGAPTPDSGLAAPLRTREKTPATWRRDHPVLRDVALDGLAVATVTPVRAGGDDVRATTLVTGDGGPWMILTDRAGVRSITVGFALDDSNWPLTVGFPIFLASAADFLTADTRPAPRSFKAGEPIDLVATAGEESTLVGPSGDTVGVSTAPGDGRVRFAPPDAAGVYNIRPGGAPVPVNLVSARESSLAVPERLAIGSAAEQGREQEEGGGPREIWRWLVLAAAALLALEWIVFALKSRL